MNTQKKEQKNPVPSKSQNLPKPQEQKELAQKAAIDALIAKREQEKEKMALLQKWGKIALTVGGVFVIFVSLPAILSWLTRVLTAAQETKTAWQNFKQKRA